jgi:hypothetical protein
MKVIGSYERRSLRPGIRKPPRWIFLKNSNPNKYDEPIVVEQDRENCREERNFRVLRIQRSAVTRIQQSLEISNVSSEWKTEYGARIASTIREILARSFVPA